MDLFNKVLGGFLGAAVGDAMGAITEMLPIEYILDFHNGFVSEFMDIPDYTIAAGMPFGSVTDDYSLADHLATAIIKNEGIIDEKLANEAIMSWYNEGHYLSMMGPSIYELVLKLKKNKNSKISNTYNLRVDNSVATNGGGMKVFPVGILSNGNVIKAINDAIIVTKNSHGNTSSLSAACAISASVSAAMHEKADLYSIVKSGLLGARLGYEKALTFSQELAVPNVEELIKMAVCIGGKKDDMLDVITDLRDLIGAGMTAYQSIPTVFGILSFSNCNFRDTLIASVNIGDDSDTVASMACAIAGTYEGAESIPETYIDIINKGNNYDLRKTARKFCNLLK